MEYRNHYRSAFPSYLDNSLLKPRSFYHTGIEEILENIVLEVEHLPVEESIEEK